MNKKTILTILFTILGTILCCCLLILAITFLPNLISDLRLRPAYQTAETFMQAIKDGNSQNAFALLAQETAEQVGEPAAIQAYFGIPDRLDSYKRGISMSSQAAQKVEVAFSVTYPNQAKGAIWLTLAKEGDEWKILNVKVTEK